MPSANSRMAPSQSLMVPGRTMACLPMLVFNALPLTSHGINDQPTDAASASIIVPYLGSHLREARLVGGAGGVLPLN